MIKANELRIGVWLNYYGSYKQIKEGSQIDEASFEGEPIPLTPEILEQTNYFGRCKIKKQDSFFNGDDILIRVADLALFLHNEANGKVWLIKRLRHVHELQNAVFGINGEEIIFKLIA